MVTAGMNEGQDGASRLNILEVISRRYPELRKSDRKVADLVSADPGWVLRAKLAETARAAGVSEPTVMRFCVAIGCAGYQDFKIQLAQCLALGITPSQSTITADDPPANVAVKVFDFTLTSLDWARKKLDTAAIARAVDVLVAAKRIEFFGFGASSIVARDAQQKFPLFGVPCGAPTDAHQQFITASLLQPGDVVVAISNTGVARSLIEVVRKARENGAKIVGISGSHTPLLRYCDVEIVVETLENTNLYTPMISRIAALVIVDILATSVALRRGPEQARRVLDMKQHLTELRATGNI